MLPPRPPPPSKAQIFDLGAYTCVRKSHPRSPWCHCRYSDSPPISSVAPQYLHLTDSPPNSAVTPQYLCLIASIPDPYVRYNPISGKADQACILYLSVSIIDYPHHPQGASTIRPRARALWLPQRRNYLRSRVRSQHVSNCSGTPTYNSVVSLRTGMIDGVAPSHADTIHTSNVCRSGECYSPRLSS